MHLTMTACWISLERIVVPRQSALPRRPRKLDPPSGSMCDATPIRSPEFVRQKTRSPCFLIQPRRIANPPAKAHGLRPMMEAVSSTFRPGLSACPAPRSSPPGCFGELCPGPDRHSSGISLSRPRGSIDPGAWNDWPAEGRCRFSNLSPGLMVPSDPIVPLPRTHGVGQAATPAMSSLT